jgi:hypothetical protein
MTFTKGAADTAMTSAITGANSGDNSTSAMMAAVFYMIAPDTGANKTLKWDWSGAGTPVNQTVFSVVFLKGVNQTTPVRGAGGGQSATSTEVDPYTTSTVTAATNDLLLACASGYPDGPTEGACATWTNAATFSGADIPMILNQADISWATGSPTGDTTAACATDTLWADGAIVAISLRPL